ncbi:uncharacterized protein LOC131620657 [Vicia villosa]|uniref:uncharacterized protein LOC131620657 n=1 Tax=Vicia villosa TaxID=3911 RepID=UPI00273CC1D2|nr:uncharacterized protein LOC131620657 [Vicia villosa]
MMAQKHLHELLQEDQEPFLLNNYISDRLTQLKRFAPNNTLQLKKHEHKPTTNVNFCKHACFFSFQNTPDIRNSPLKSPVRSSNDLFLQIPAKTASLLLDAALKIHNKKPHSKNKNKSFGVFGSFFKKLTQRSRTKTEGDVSVKDILRWDSRNRKSFNKGGTEVCSCEVGFTCSCNGRHSSSAVWSESNEAETSSSGHSHSCDSVEDVEFVMMNTKKQNVADCGCFDQHGFFCESPFRFILEKSPSTSGRRTPEFSSPVESPSRHQPEDKQNNGVDDVKKFESGEDEEEKEQCSPVSVLDTPFEDYHDDDCHENDNEEDDFDLDGSYANVQRTKQQLLDRLRRFEQLAELDPLELEKRMQEDNEETFFEEDDDEEDCEEKSLREMVCEILCHSSDHERWQEQEALKRLVYDLIKEELNYSQDMNNVVKRVCKKMDLWKEVECNTIDMMIEEDFSREKIGWKKNDEVTKELAREVEVAIFCFLVDEFSEELVC